jgi:hypothetical protein
MFVLMVLTRDQLPVQAAWVFHGLLFDLLYVHLSTRKAVSGAIYSIYRAPCVHLHVESFGCKTKVKFVLIAPQ